MIYFRNTYTWKPSSLAGRVLVFKDMHNDWYQYRNTFTNMNIFSSMRTAEYMVKRTHESEEECSAPGDYLGYTDLFKANSES